MTCLGECHCFRQDLRGSLLHNQPHDLLRDHHHLIVLLLAFDAMRSGAAGITYICIKTVYNEKLLVSTSITTTVLVLTVEIGCSFL